MRAGRAILSDRAARDLAAALRTSISGEVRFDAGSRALYATDASNYREVPIGVVIPRTVEDVLRTVALCREHGAPVMPRGGGTSLAGQCCNVAVVVDMSKYLNRVLAIDPTERLARVEPGCVLDRLRDDAERYHLTFGPDPSTHDHNTLGGMIGNNSCGVHSVMAGRTADNVRALDILTYDGQRMTVGRTDEASYARILAGGGRQAEIYRALRDLRDRYADQIRARYPKIPRRVSGFNLDELLPENGFHVARALVGSEGTCVTVLSAELELVPSPPCRALLVLGYPDVFAAGDQVPEILTLGPIGLEGLDDVLVADMEKKKMRPDPHASLPEGNGWLLVEFGGDSRDEARERAEEAMQALRRSPNPPRMKCFTDPAEAAKLWEIRRSGLGATARVPGQQESWEGWEDAAVPPNRVGPYLRDFRALLNRYDYHGALYGHFGDGCIHVRIDFGLRDEPGIRKFRRFTDEAANLVLRYGGSFSGEHGDGQARADLLPKLFGDELVEAFHSFKSIWDPDWKMNPGKVVDPDRRDQNLRIRDFHPSPPPTVFAYPDDDNNFAEATARCVGVGKCRRRGGGVMCPSYMATGEEMYSTRGRARLLFEMVKGDTLTKGWKSEAVHQALDLCLACKGCRSDCPVHVDMATYKAEFNAHYYKGRLRPPEAYAMGLIYWWARMASRAPGLANFLGQTPGLSALAKRVGNIAPERRLPRFASQTFRAWFRRRPRRQTGGPEVLLFPDTFSNYFHPCVARAAVEVLEHAGYEVTIPQRSLCCGRPLFDWGMLDSARRLLKQTVATLIPAIERGVPVVGLEPACVASFRDELPHLFPGDRAAHRVSERTYMLSELLTGDNAYRPPQIDGKALVHIHCHHHAVLDVGNELDLLRRTGIDHTVLESGCCGMAGAFGFERSHYDVSQRAAERVLFPAVRAADPETMIVSDGFSCREQIEQGTGRHVLHIAELLRNGLGAHA